MFFVPLTKKQRIRLYLSWAYWRQVGPMYRVTMWWLNRPRGCETCDGIGCPCFRTRDWQSIEQGCGRGCDDCGLRSCRNEAT